MGPLLAHAQARPIASTTASESSEIPQASGTFGPLRGLNSGISFSSLHDSQTGWATLLQPAIGYSFNDIFSFDITAPIYLYRLAGSKAAASPKTLLTPHRGELGDILFSLHAEFIPHGFLYQGSVSATAPTGDPTYGLSTGHATFDFSNRFERSFKYATPSIEIGTGDSSSLVNPLVQRDLTSLGPVAHFQAGFSFPLPRSVSFDANAYEQLPIGDQKTYQTIARRGRTPLTVVTGRNVVEDNGFTSSIDIPLDGHVTLSTYYSRSLRLKDDVVAFGLTYVLRSSRPANKDLPADEQLLHSIQQQLQPTTPH